MTGERGAIWPFALLGGAIAKIAALPTRNIRLTVLLCVVAIGGSFAAAGVLQMRFERVQASRQAVYFDTKRAQDLAALAEASLIQYERLGKLFADDEIGDGALAAVPTLRGIAVADKTGLALHQTGESIDMSALAALAQNGRTVLGAGARTLIVFAYEGKAVAVSFDTSQLAPGAALDGAALASLSGATLAGTASNSEVVRARSRGWPVEAQVAVDDQDATAAWYGSLPLYLFVILGPALVGGWLAAVFVREFERRAKAAGAIRALKSAHPAEAKLLVRLANAERNAHESLRAKDEFVAHMSHELRTPLNAIIGFSEVIERGFYGPVGHAKYIEYAHDIGVAGRSLHDKIGDILEFANLEAGRYPLEISGFDATEIACASVSENAGRAFSRRIGLDIEPALPAMVRADPQAVKRIVTNLLANALLYTQEGGEVRVAVREEEGAVAIRVTDNGSGFNPRETQAAGIPFLRFERAGISSGAGLGLAIVMALARRMGGAVRLESVHGAGTSAELRLPRA